MKKFRLFVIGALFFAGAGAAFAHSTVGPKQVGVGMYQTFSLAVPVERDVPTTAIRLVLPDNIATATPNVKPGWKIELKKTGEGHEAKVREISWTGGSIEAGLRDEFLFSAKTPDKEGEIAWKAYQTYADGNVVAWELDPKAEQPKDASGKADFSKFGPYSVTKVVNDLATTNQSVDTHSDEEHAGSSGSSKTSMYISIAALALAGISIVNSRKKQ